MAFGSPTTLLAAFGFLLTTIALVIFKEHAVWRPNKAQASWVHSVLETGPTTDSEAPGRRVSTEGDAISEKEGTTSKETLKKSATPIDYKDIFPPSSRDALKLALVKKNGMVLKDRSHEEIIKNLISFGADYRDCGPSTCTPTGVSIEEIYALGDFPDYALMGGIPLPNPYREFDIAKAIARPYRPFRWAYHQTMSLTKLEPDWWLELESTYVDRIAERRALFAKHGKLVLNYLPGSELACKEVMEFALQFLCARYPQHFSLTCSPTTGEHTFHNGLLSTSTPTNSLHPLHMLLQNVPEDFAIMIRNPADGQYYFRAGLLCSSLGWNVDTKLGLKLSEIHDPIPDFKEKMQFSMDRYFSKLPLDKPIQRGSWGLEVDQPLFMPPGDPHERYREKQDPDLALDRLHLRVDWQTLRRMPLSGGIIFNFKALFTPITEFRTEPYIPSLIRTVLRHGNPSIMAYKSTWHVEHKVLPALDAWAQEQEDEGLVDKGWEVRTLDESPFFRGWEGVWRGRQGF